MALLETKKLLVASGITTGNKKLLVAAGRTTRNKDATRNKGHRYLPFSTPTDTFRTSSGI